MTTPPTTQPRTPRVLAAAGLWVLGASAVLTVAGALGSGRTAALSAALGGAVVLIFFSFGAGFVNLAARIAPQTSVLVALITYTLQVALVGLLFAALTSSDVFERTLSQGWLAAGLIVGTFAWMLGQVLSTLRTPIEPWEPTEARDLDAPVPGSVSGPEAGAA